MRKHLGRMEAFDALLESLTTEPEPRREANRRRTTGARKPRRPEPLPTVPTPPRDPKHAAAVLHP